MYLKLGTIGIKYASDVQSYIILSEVLGSQVSYEKPILVTTPSEFEIWFGKDHEYHDYYIRLLQEGTTLYLYKPLSSRYTGIDYIDLDSYTPEISMIYPTQGFLPVPKVISMKDKYSAKLEGGSWWKWDKDSWEEAEESELEDYTYQGEFSELPVMPKIGYKYWIVENSEWFVWKDHDWLGEDKFIPGFSESLDNRDTILITRPDVNTSLEYSYPEFSYQNQETGVYSRNYRKNFSGAYVDQSGILNGYKTLVTIFKFTKDEFDSQGFIVFNDVSGNKHILYTQTVPSFIDQTVTPHQVGNIEDVIRCLEVLGWTIDTEDERKTLYVYSGDPIDCTYYYDFPGLTLEASFSDTHNMISKYIHDSNLSGIEMWSKTIGHTSDSNDLDCDIEVEIENSDSPGYFRFTITRYTYSETFEGPIKPIPGEEERLDYTISKNSKLIYCNFLNIVSGLRVGKYTLRRSRLEKQEPKNFILGLQELFNLKGESIYPDYVFIPRLDKYTSGPESDKTYYPIYDTFLEYAKEYNCQFLVQNNESKYTIKEVSEFPTNVEPWMEYTIFKKGSSYKWVKNGTLVDCVDREILEIAQAGGDYVFNLREPDNRLVYFYKNMTWRGYERPGWFIYLEGLFKDIYSMTTKEINYASPVLNPYSDNEDIERVLEKYKSNYLVCNNHLYYYKKYMNGNSYTTTGWMRFIVGKIFRELQKNRWSMLSQKNMGVVRSKFVEILAKVKNSFSMVHNILLTDFTPVLLENSVSVSFDVYLKDLVDNNISLNITINYNKHE